MTPSAQTACLRHRSLTGRFLASCQACCTAAAARRVVPATPEATTPRDDRTFALAA